MSFALGFLVGCAVTWVALTLALLLEAADGADGGG